MKKIVVSSFLLVFAGSVFAQENGGGRSIESAQRFIAAMAEAGQIQILREEASTPFISAWNDGFGKGKKPGGIGCKTELNDVVDDVKRRYQPVAWGGVSSINVSEVGEVDIEGGVVGGSIKLKTSPEYAARLAAAFNFLKKHAGRRSVALVSDNAASLKANG